MTVIFIHYLLIAVVASFVLYIIGHLISWLVRYQAAGFFLPLFVKLLIGCISFTAICALYFTSLKTVFAGIIISIAYFIVGHRKGLIRIPNHQFRYRTELLAMLLFLLVTSIIYGYRFYSVSYNGTSILNIPNPDFTFYARISNYLVNSGIESATPTLIYPELNTVNPYHYFDLWFNGGISYISGANDLQILFLVSYTLGIAFVWLGFCALAESLAKVSAFTVVMGVLATFFIPLPWKLTELINEELNKFFLLGHAPAEYLDYGLWNMTKIYVVYLILVLAMLAFIKKEKNAGLAIISLLLFFYTTIAIPIMLAMSAYVLYDYKFISKDKNEFITSLVFIVLFNIFILVFYSGYLADSAGNQLAPFHRLGVEPLYKSIFRPMKIFLDATLQLLILLIPIIVLLLIELAGSIRLKDIPGYIYRGLLNNSYTPLVVILYSAALGTWSLLHDVIDANQFFATCGTPMINILCFILVLFLRKIYVKVLLMVICFFLVKDTNQDILEQRLYSEEYMINLKNVIMENGNVRGFLLSSRDYEEAYGNNVVEALGEYVTLFRSDNYGVNLSGIGPSFGNHYASSDSTYTIENQSDFTRFIQEQKSRKQYVSIDQSRIDFIDNFNIDYLVISPHVNLDTLLSKRVTETITDSYSKQTVLLIKKKER